MNETFGIEEYWEYTGFSIKKFFNAFFYWHIIMIIGPPVQFFNDLLKRKKTFFKIFIHTLLHAYFFSVSIFNVIMAYH